MAAAASNAFGVGLCTAEPMAYDNNTAPIKHEVDEQNSDDDVVGSSVLAQQQHNLVVEHMNTAVEHAIQG